MTTIYPFHDRPDIGIPVVFYEIPRGRPGLPPTVFRPHWWEIRDLYERRGVGTPEHSEWRIWRGPYPQGEVQPLLGTPDQWKNGVSYADYLAGVLPGRERCINVQASFTSFTSRGMAQGQSAVAAVVSLAGFGMAGWSDWSDEQLAWTSRSSWGAFSSHDTGPERFTSRGQWTQISRQAWSSPQAWTSRGMTALLSWSNVDAQAWVGRGLAGADNMPVGNVTWTGRGMGEHGERPQGEQAWTGRGLWLQSST